MRYFPLLLLLIIGGCAVRPHAVTVGQTTFILARGLPNVEHHLLGVHEAVHRAQYRERGLFGFLWTYLARPSERLAMEARAYAAALCRASELEAPEREIVRLRNRYAEALSGYAPENPLSIEEARAYVDSDYAGGAGCDPGRWKGIPEPPEPVLMETNAWRKEAQAARDIQVLLEKGFRVEPPSLPQSPL